MELTQGDYKLYTNSTVCYPDQEWATIVGIAEKRLASFLCLEKFPELTEENKALAMLLANFIAAALRFQGTPDVIESKSVRNFTINFKSSAANAFEQIYSQYEDIIEMYSGCGTEIKVEDSACHCCGYYSNGYYNF